MKVFIWWLGLLVIMILSLSTLIKLEIPFKEASLMPRCQNEVIVSPNLINQVISFSNSYISSGVGEDYFDKHYKYFDISYSTDTCEFLVKYVYVYEDIHTIMSMNIQVIKVNEFKVSKVNAFITPVEITFSIEDAIKLVESQNISYDYYNKEISIPSQTIIYKFYKDTLSEGKVLVFEVDAQSKEVISVKKVVKDITPIV